MEDLAAWHRVEWWVLTALGSSNGGVQQPKAWRRRRGCFVLWAPTPSSPRARNPFPPSAGSLLSARRFQSSEDPQLCTEPAGGRHLQEPPEPALDKSHQTRPHFQDHSLFAPAPAHKAKPKTKGRQLSWGKQSEKLQEHFENRVQCGEGPRYIQRSALHAVRQMSCAVDSYLRWQRVIMKCTHAFPLSPTHYVHLQSKDNKNNENINLHKS